MTPVGILLAAGRGRRFDPLGTRNKLLQPLAGGQAVVVASARNLLAVLPRVVAVVRADDEVARALRAVGCEVTVCADADDGMAASLVHAVGLTASAPGWLIALGDMPHVLPSTIAALCEALAGGARIAAPVMEGRRGNPVAFSAACRPALLALTGDQGARALLQSAEPSAIEVADRGIFHDIDTPSDLASS